MLACQLSCNKCCCNSSEEELPTSASQADTYPSTMVELPYVQNYINGPESTKEMADRKENEYFSVTSAHPPPYSSATKIV
ncbi:hypothetical protein HDE_14106 [Halotydeus destructor]|nr:hypothetical protein HDE_14106 [Halotydeus destructor]